MSVFRGSPNSRGKIGTARSLYVKRCHWIVLFSQNRKTCIGRPRAVLPHKSYIAICICICSVKVWGFELFWYEIEYRFCYFSSGIMYHFRTRLLQLYAVWHMKKILRPWNSVLVSGQTHVGELSNFNLKQVRFHEARLTTPHQTDCRVPSPRESFPLLNCVCNSVKYNNNITF